MTENSILDVIIPTDSDDFDFKEGIKQTSKNFIALPMCIVLTKTEYQNAVYDFKMV
jgi:hypothetical protein